MEFGAYQDAQAPERSERSLGAGVAGNAGSIADLFPKLVSMQRLCGSTAFALLTVQAHTLLKPGQIECVVQSPGSQDQVNGFIRDRSEFLLGHLYSSPCPLIMAPRDAVVFEHSPATIVRTDDGTALHLAFPVQLGTMGNGFVVFFDARAILNNDLLMDMHRKSVTVMREKLRLAFGMSVGTENLNDREIECLQLVGNGMKSEAIGEQLTCVFVDHGLLRMNEREQVERLFRDHYNIPLVVVDAEERFMAGLAGITDPEQKRKFIGAEFINVFEEEARKIGGADFLAQGTLYPDVIESVSFTGGPSVTIKSHHNVGGLPERMNMKLVEPLRELFKDEVRELGRELGLPEIFVGRHPFPGPGLAIRIPGEVTKERCDILRKADAIYLEEIRNAGLYDAIWQAFAVLLPVKTVGVMGDGRTYDSVCGLRAVTSTDGMTADVYPFDSAFLSRVATRIINEVQGINRVVYDYTSKPPGTIEWE